MHGETLKYETHSGFKNHSFDVTQGNNCPVGTYKGKGKVHSGPEGE